MVTVAGDVGSDDGVRERVAGRAGEVCCMDIGEAFSDNELIASISPILSIARLISRS